MFSLRISELRKKKGVTQSEIAEILNVTNKAYSAYERQRNQMNHEMLCRLADYYGVSTDYLLGRDVTPPFLSDEEQEIIDNYRGLDERGKKSVKNNISFEVEQSKKK